MANNQLPNAINFIKENDFLTIQVCLHLHMEEEFKGKHGISISVEKEKRHHRDFSIDLENWSVENAKIEHKKVYSKIKSIYPKTTKRVITYTDDEYPDYVD